MQVCMHCQLLSGKGLAHMQQDVEGLEKPVLEVLPLHRVHRKGICAAAGRARIHSRLMQQCLQRIEFISYRFPCSLSDMSSSHSDLACPCQVQGHYHCPRSHLHARV